MSEEKYIAITINPDRGEVVERPAPGADPDQDLHVVCRTATHLQAYLIADGLNAADRYQELRAAVIEVCSQRADDHCWMDLSKLAALVGVELDMHVGDKAAMLKNCERFVNDVCSAGGPWKSYAELEKELESMKTKSATKGGYNPPPVIAVIKPTLPPPPPPATSYHNCRRCGFNHRRTD